MVRDTRASLGGQTRLTRGHVRGEPISRRVALEISCQQFLRCRSGARVYHRHLRHRMTGHSVGADVASLI